MSADEEEEAESEEAGGESVAENKADETALGNNAYTIRGNQRTLQLLWSEREFPFYTKLLEIS